MHLRKIQISFFIRKNSYLHLRKIQIYFWFLKKFDNVQIFETQKVNHDNKSIMNIFQQKY